MLTHAVVVELFPRFDSKRVSHEMFHTNALHCNLSSSRLPDETGRTVAAVLALPVRFTICAGSYAKKYKRWVVNLNIEKQKKKERLVLTTLTNNQIIIQSFVHRFHGSLF